MNSPSLLLGSSSRYRAELLARLGVPFDQASPDIDERAFDDRFAGSTSSEFALSLARAKAEALAGDGASSGQSPRRTGWILCADQVGVLGEGTAERELLSKPGTDDRCVDQLMRMSGRTHELVSGIVLRDARTGRTLERVDRQVLTMRPFERAEASAYVAEFAPVDCAGGYRIEDAGIRLFERIRSDDFTGIIGLPLIATAGLLREAGILTP